MSKKLYKYREDRANKEIKFQVDFIKSFGRTPLNMSTITSWVEYNMGKYIFMNRLNIDNIKPEALNQGQVIFKAEISTNAGDSEFDYLMKYLQFFYFLDLVRERCKKGIKKYEEAKGNKVKVEKWRYRYKKLAVWIWGKLTQELGYEYGDSIIEVKKDNELLVCTKASYFESQLRFIECDDDAIDFLGED